MERRSLLRDLLRTAKKSYTLLFSFITLFALVFFAIFPQYFVKIDYREVNLPDRLTAPCLNYPLGTDFLGRDLVSLIIWGCRLAIIEMVWPTLIAATIGVILGLIAGYIGGRTDQIIMRCVDIMMSFPGFLLAMAILTILGPGLMNAMWAVTIGRISGYVRLARGLALPMKEIGYIEYAKALGTTKFRIMTRYIFPNVLTPILVQCTFSMPGTLSAVAGLSFLGLGGRPPIADWGVLLQQSRKYLRYSPWAVLAPGSAIFLVALAFNTIGEALRDIVDPRSDYITFT